ncbi:uncharacterized protein LOC126782348 [Argentina anserina]|uniref:uncharacterized protein LOC126782348 n=1 Tax=Argentina anserina TaxID=57926 RepID=UPI002176424D|nr:uncharacterized protein LOC126782348 [Potentilla anserina]
MSQDSEKVSLKLLIDKENHKVVFAEAGKEFVDFLFTLLSFPLSSAIRVCKIGSLSNIYGSIDALGDKYMLPNVNKKTIVGMGSMEHVAALNKLQFMFSNKPQDHKPIVASSAKKFYVCNKYHMKEHRPCVTDDPRSVSPICRSPMSTDVVYVAPRGEASLMTWGEGYVRGVASYMIMDDLRVQPVSVFDNLNLLEKYINGSSGFNNLEEKVVHVNMDQVDKWLKASTESNSVLTDIFLGKKAIA